MAAVDPRMLDLVWIDRHDYEALLHKRPVTTVAEVTSSNGSSKTAVPAASPAPVAAVPSDGKDGTDAPASVAHSSTQCVKQVESKQATSMSLLAELEAARGFIRESLQSRAAGTTSETLLDRAIRLETNNKSLKKLVQDLTDQIEKIEARVKNAPAPADKPKKEECDEDDFKFSDDEEEETPRESAMERMKRLATEKKAEEAAKAAAQGHVGPITKSNVVLDCKPWDDETDLVVLEKAVRDIYMEGLKWGDSKLVDIGYGIKKLRISTAIVDHLVGLYDLEDKITALDDYIQSVDIVSHNKI